MANYRGRKATIMRHRKDFLALDAKWASFYRMKIGVIAHYPLCKTNLKR